MERDPDAPWGHYVAIWLPRVREPVRFPVLAHCAKARKRGTRAAVRRKRIEDLLKELG